MYISNNGVQTGNITVQNCVYRRRAAVHRRHGHGTLRGAGRRTGRCSSPAAGPQTETERGGVSSHETKQKQPVCRSSAGAVHGRVLCTARAGSPRASANIDLSRTGSMDVTLYDHQNDVRGGALTVLQGGGRGPHQRRPAHFVYTADFTGCGIALGDPDGQHAGFRLEAKLPAPPPAPPIRSASRASSPLTRCRWAVLVVQTGKLQGLRGHQFLPGVAARGRKRLALHRGRHPRWRRAHAGGDPRPNRKLPARLPGTGQTVRAGEALGTGQARSPAPRMSPDNLDMPVNPNDPNRPVSPGTPDNPVTPATRTTPWPRKPGQPGGSGAPGRQCTAPERPAELAHPFASLQRRAAVCRRLGAGPKETLA